MLKHNLLTLDQLNKAAATGADCCVVNPCGSGKTSVMAEFIKGHPEKSFVIITKQGNAKVYFRSLDSVFDDITIVTYSKMLRDVNSGNVAAYDADVYILDEAHYAGADQWGKALLILKELYHPQFIGFTATPQRYEQQGTTETVVGSLFAGNMAGGFTPQQLCKDGVFTEPEYILSVFDLGSDICRYKGRVEESCLPDAEKARLYAKLDRTYAQWKGHSDPETVLAEALPRYMYKEHCNRILVYVSSVAEVEEKRKTLDPLFSRIFGEVPASYRYTHKDPESNLAEFLEEDDAYLKVLYSVDKIMETVHIDDMNIAIMLRPSVSNRIITQQFGRVNSIGNDKKPLIIDMVDNLSNLKASSISMERQAGCDSTSDGKQAALPGLRHISPYRSVFHAVEEALSGARQYVYKGCRGTLKQLCEVYGKPYSEVQKLMSGGAGLAEAFESVQGKKAKPTQDIFDGLYMEREFVPGSSFANVPPKYFTIVERFIAKKGIKDEDLKQELRMEMLYQVSKHDDDRSPTATVLTALTQLYMRYCRDKNVRASMYADGMDAAESCESLAGHIAVAETAVALDAFLCGIMEGLTDRERKVIALRFGFGGNQPMTYEEAGVVFGVTRERVRQIEIKALKKLKGRCLQAGVHDCGSLL